MAAVPTPAPACAASISPERAPARRAQQGRGRPAVRCGARARARATSQKRRARWLAARSAPPYRVRPETCVVAARGSRPALRESVCSASRRRARPNLGARCAAPTLDGASDARASQPAATLALRRTHSTGASSQLCLRAALFYRCEAADLWHTAQGGRVRVGLFRDGARRGALEGIRGARRAAVWRAACTAGGARGGGWWQRCAAR